MKRTQDTIEENTLWKKPRTIGENLQDSTNSLASTLNALRQSVTVLESLTPKVHCLSSFAHMERKYEMVTIHDIDAARRVVMHSTKPEIDRLLAEAQLLLDEKIRLTRQIEQKVDGQDKALITKTPSYTTDQAKMTTEKRNKRSHHTSLMGEYNRCDAKLTRLELELEQLDEKIKYRQDQLQQRDTTDRELAMEEKRLMQDLAQLEVQLKDRQQKPVESHVKVDQPGDDDTVVLDMDFTNLSKDVLQQNLTMMENLLAGILEGTAHFSSTGLPLYLEAIQRYQTKCSQSLQLEQKVENNISLLKTYCKTLMPKDNMGFIAQRLIDILFTKDGYSALTKESLLQKFPSPRQKEVVKKLLDRYDFTYIQ
ncbi:hypothetical protein [Absidia glauca]|uniref:DASH complex subunit SPC19 n=1 Tax=Absidia glauca TaxID=4829 RepID=A0A163KS82_ABSGL|nr:hypothetical protein [Absidia glauca]